MKIGIIGAGRVGGTLGKLWAAKGHSILFASRDPQSEKMQQLLAEAGSNARAGSVPEAAEFGEVIVLATPWSEVESTLAQAARSLDGKVLIDCTNPINAQTFSVVDLGGVSGGERVAQLAPTARVVKDFNSLGANLYGTPVIGGQQASMFFCGDDPEAKAVVQGLTAELGFDPVDAGPLVSARQLESLCLLWFSVAPQSGWTAAFKVLKP